MILLACAAPANERAVAPEPPGPWDLASLANIAHRGSGLLAPEATLVAYENAVSVGADALECDAHATADGVVVCMHDATVDRTTDDGLTYPYRGAGLVVPTLAEVLAAFPELLFTIEIKQTEPSIIDTVVADLDAHGGRARVIGRSFV